MSHTQKEFFVREIIKKYNLGIGRLHRFNDYLLIEIIPKYFYVCFDIDIVLDPHKYFFTIPQTYRLYLYNELKSVEQNIFILGNLIKDTLWIHSRL
ncbi:hypothetical protein EON71_00245 [bacterium]|nr:MAG: hypothetical protein EON71_00245 [bacterium]